MLGAKSSGKRYKHVKILNPLEVEDILEVKATKIDDLRLETKDGKPKVTSIHKAINSNEVPVKEKHARTIVLGTYHEKGAGMYWGTVNKLPLQGNHIICWKFCHILHKILRDGHKMAIVDSLKYMTHLTDLGKLWGHLKEGYGKLIGAYTKLLVQKLAFHKKNPNIPGNLVLTDQQLDEMAGRDPNGYFELSVDMLDYMDEILSLQAAVFNSLDMSRSNSMTNTGQCRLAPLIQCIQDSCALYDYIVKLLFKLHAVIPPDTLSGHRSRFLKQYGLLKTFYLSSGNLQYFKTLIQVPVLPENPPNFLIASDLASHVTPKVVLPPEPEIETPEVETVTADLVDTTVQQSDKFDEVFGTNLGDFNFSGQNGTPSPPVPDERDQLIQQLMAEIERLKQENARLKERAEEAIGILKQRIADLEERLEEMKKQAQEAEQEKENLKSQLEASAKDTAAVAKLEEMEKHAKASDEKFKKMKDIYGKLREEHVTLIRSFAEVEKQVKADKTVIEEKEQTRKALEQELEQVKMEQQVFSESLQKSADDVSSQLAATAALNTKLEQEKQSLEEQMESLDKTKSSLESSLSQLQSDLASLQEQLDQAKADKETTQNQHKITLGDMEQKMLDRAITEGEAILQDAIDQFDSSAHNSVMGTAEYLLSRAEPVLPLLAEFKQSIKGYGADKALLDKLIHGILTCSHGLGETIVQGKSTSNSASNVEQGDELINACRGAGEEGLQVLELLKKGALDDASSQLDKVTESVQKIMQLGETLLPKVEDVKTEDIGDLVDQEMQSTADAIEQATKKFQEILEQSRKTHSGIQLEVNEKMLDSCTSLIMAIKILVEKAKDLQREIVSQGRGTSSAKEFYKKHHRWTEGLISAAKAVGWGANVLVEGADKVVRGEGKFEELMVCSQEIAASTAQLVVASKVKAERGSQALAQMSHAAKGVSEATGNVVATAKNAAAMVEEQDTLDFSKITLHQAKRLEMDSQVRVLELESLLEKERVKLSELRKKHYQLAGESEQAEEAKASGDH
ncbi:huntingtin-interacting protein 1 isoform X1 [Lingula anatina]|uniref:Huntingtin-interacting protein 1 isoform X1 n=1 Tax=Lingula anatina TaxID=7574 RepID=A0A1S3H844_LINAN|nr:huntingtin-interacting protein 1 isoform X1 [Lingula anatina]|eukprot:XP_013381294.1 huntingtin-interacting protein 1 isoform X1 [Lingula anatina]